jgi:hypothetical protein
MNLYYAINENVMQIFMFLYILNKFSIFTEFFIYRLLVELNIIKPPSRSLGGESDSRGLDKTLKLGEKAGRKTIGLKPDSSLV